MDSEEHRKRHEELHEMLDELVADYIQHEMGVRHGKESKHLSNTNIMDLMEWSYEQTQDPDEPHHDGADVDVKPEKVTNNPLKEVIKKWLSRLRE